MKLKRSFLSGVNDFGKWIRSSGNTAYFLGKSAIGVCLVHRSLFSMKALGEPFPFIRPVAERNAFFHQSLGALSPTISQCFKQLIKFSSDAILTFDPFWSQWASPDVSGESDDHAEESWHGECSASALCLNYGFWQRSHLAATPLNPRAMTVASSPVVCLPSSQRKSRGAMQACAQNCLKSQRNSFANAMNWQNRIVNGYGECFLTAPIPKQHVFFEWHDLGSLASCQVTKLIHSITTPSTFCLLARLWYFGACTPLESRAPTSHCYSNDLTNHPI